MARNKVAPEEMHAMLQDMADRIERGGVRSVSFRLMTDAGEQEYSFSTETEEEQLAALLTIRKLLGQVH